MPTVWTDGRDRRVLIAVLAAHPELKLDYAKLAVLMGDTTKVAVQHRFRVLKKEATQMSSDLETGATLPLADTRKRAPTDEPRTPKKRTRKVVHETSYDLEEDT